MFNNYFENQSIWNTLSTKKLVLSSYHEKGSGSWARISSAFILFFTNYGSRSDYPVAGETF